MSQIQKSISLDEKIWEKIDQIRDDLPRSRFVARIITERLQTLEDTPKLDHGKK
jgi:metal-responsive CopG/Arc/MetJ family transcriptional regulator